MKVCILGAGAIGSIIAVRLALAGEEVCVVERGSRLAQIRRDGLRIRWQDGMVYTARVGVFTRLTEVGEQDLVVLAVKAYDLEEAVQHIDGLLSGNTGVMTVQNGIPWWYFQKVGGSFDGAPLVSVDPNGKLSNAISPDRLIGCVTYAAAALQAQGTVQHVEGDRLTVGELDGSMTERMRRISEAFERAG